MVSPRNISRGMKRVRKEKWGMGILVTWRGLMWSTNATFYDL